MRFRTGAPIICALASSVLLLCLTHFQSPSLEIVALVAPSSASGVANAPCCLSGHWRIGRLNMSLHDTLDDVSARVAPQSGFVPSDGSDVRLHVASATGMPLRIIPRAPTFLTLSRPAALPWPPEGSLHVERPPWSRENAKMPPTCLYTRDAARRRSSFASEWTIEAVVLFLNNPHFGHQWQTIFGLNGAALVPRLHAPHTHVRRCVACTGFNMTDSSDAHLSSLALKLSPKLGLLLQAWLAPQGAMPQAPPRLVSVWSSHSAQANAWYHVVVRCAAGKLELHVNGFLEASAPFDGQLARPPRPSDGDLTFGCGMHKGVPADTCSCLLSEVRAANQSLSSHEWLWTPKIGKGAGSKRIEASGQQTQS